MSTTQSTSNAPSNYTIIRPAGEGKSAQVLLAVDNPTMSSARHKFLANQKKEAVALAVSKIVAIKKATTQVSLANERNVLEKIRSKASLHNGSNHIVKLLNADLGPDPQRLILSSMPVCCDLHSVIMHATNEGIRLPPFLVWSVFEQLYRALYFLQEMCNPRIQHGDLNTTNVLIGYHTLPAQGMPSCMVIDFGEAAEGGKDNTEQLLDVVGLLAQEAEDDDQMNELVAAWGDENLGKKGIGEAWKRFRGAAQAAIAAATIGEVKELAALVCEADGAAGIEKNVQELLAQ